MIRQLSKAAAPTLRGHVFRSMSSTASYPNINTFRTHTPEDGFVLNSIYEPIPLPDLTVDQYVWKNISKWQNKFEFRMSYSATGNDLYHLLPYRIHRQPLCDVLNTVYRHSLMEDAKLYSSAPYSKDKKVNLCDLAPQRHYYFRNYSISPSLFPSSLEEGRYLLEMLVYEKNGDEIINGVLCTQLVT